MKETALFSLYGDSYGEKFRKQEDRIKELEKQVEKLKGDADSVFDNWCNGDEPCPHLKKRDEQLIKAKKIIKTLLRLWNDVMTEDTVKALISEAEQFLKEVHSDERPVQTDDKDKACH